MQNVISLVFLLILQSVFLIDQQSPSSERFSKSSRFLNLCHRHKPLCFSSKPLRRTIPIEFVGLRRPEAWNSKVALDFL